MKKLFAHIYIKRGHTHGFTLVETLVAISVLLVSITAPMFLVHQSLQASRFAENELTAFYLAQDALEYVRYVRDTNQLANDDWLDGLAACRGGNTCYIDTIQQTITQCPVGGCPPLRFSESNNTYQYASGSPTIYVRSVVVTEIGARDEATVTVTVRWSEGVFSGQEVTYTSNIFDY